MKLERNQMYQGDALESLSSVLKNSVDLNICDGPFGVTQNDWDRITSCRKHPHFCPRRLLSTVRI